MKKKRTLLFIIVFVLAAALSTFGLYYDHIHFDHSKENIFEIPGTYSLWDCAGSLFYSKYYFIQKPPDEEQELRTMVETFIKENNVLVDAKNSGAEYVSLRFMIPDYRLPIYFEENKSFWNMDDFIRNYIRSNEILLYTYDIKSNETEYIVRELYREVYNP